jgi:hypothetical protein
MIRVHIITRNAEAVINDIDNGKAKLQLLHSTGKLELRVVWCPNVYFDLMAFLNPKNDKVTF